MARRVLADLLSATDLAVRWGCCKRTALRRLKRLDKKHGGRLILTYTTAPGAQVFTTLTLLKQCDERWLEAREVDTARTDDLVSAQADTNVEIQKLRARIRILESAA